MFIQTQMHGLVNIALLIYLRGHAVLCIYFLVCLIELIKW